MSKKFGARRRGAFLKALGETGNQTLSAGRAKVSRSWVTLHRANDPEFDAACREAMAAAKARFDAARDDGSCKPPTGWGHLDGVELVVRGSNGRRTQIARAGPREWDPRTEDRFLGTLAATCNVKAACAEVGRTATSAYAHRKRWPAFAARWDAAIEQGYARLELALIERACNLFSATEVLTPDAMPPMTTPEALRQFHMHKHAARGVGKKPGLPAREPTFEEVGDYFSRALGAAERAGTVSETVKARDRREWARRRGSGQARRRGGDGNPA